METKYEKCGTINTITIENGEIKKKVCDSNYTFRLVTKQCGIHYDTMIVPFIPFAEWMVQ
jgi:hypothetical protein